MAELKARGLRKSVGVSGLFATAYGNVGSSIYYALGLCVRRHPWSVRTRLPKSRSPRTSRFTLEVNLRADDHGAFAWQPEGVDWARRVAGHRDEQPLAPTPHGRGVGRRDRDPREEVLGVLEVQVAFEQALLATEPQQDWDVERLVVADPQASRARP